MMMISVALSERDSDTFLGIHLNLSDQLCVLLSLAVLSFAL